MSRPLYAFREDYEVELANLDRFLSPGMVFVDVGACYGCYTLAASKLVGRAGRVVAVEPACQAFQVLRQNVQMNALENVYAYRGALSQGDGKARLYHHPDHTRNSLGEHLLQEGEFEEVDTKSLDNILQEISVNHVHVIKIDAEGSEELVLRGSGAILRETHPTVIFEINPGAAKRLGLSPMGAWDLLSSMGYSFFQLDQQGQIAQIRLAPADGNVLAIHESQN